MIVGLQKALLMIVGLPLKTASCSNCQQFLSCTKGLGRIIAL